MTGTIRLLIADRAIARDALREALDGDVEICAEVEEVAYAIRAAKREQPDLCLLGDTITGDLLAAVQGIARAAPHAAVVVLTEAPHADGLLDAVRAGAVGYVPGPLDANQLRRVVRAAAADEAVVPRAMVREILWELRGVGVGAGSLTLRQAQVLGMLRRRHTTAEIAERLAIAPVTVRRHISQLVQKLGVADRAELTGDGAQ